MDKLKDIATKYRTDKGNAAHSFNGESYLDVYERYFEPLRNNRNTLLEIGVLKGQSIQLWLEYFPQSLIIGLDINREAIKYVNAPARIFIGNQEDPEILQRIIDLHGVPNIVIDDGSHINTITLKTFKFLFDKMPSGSLYIIEDPGCSYLGNMWNYMNKWPGLKLNKINNYNNDRNDMNNFFLQILEDMDHQKGLVRSIQFWSATCILIRA